jgi:hypothetical protein
MALARIRTIKEAYDMIKALDPGSSLSYFSFRKIVLSGAIPHFMNGNKYLLNYEDVETYFGNSEFAMPVASGEEQLERGGICKVHI